MMEEQAILWRQEKEKFDSETKNQIEHQKKELEENAKFL
jgi:hypothetical protein